MADNGVDGWAAVYFISLPAVPDIAAIAGRFNGGHGYGACSRSAGLCDSPPKADMVAPSRVAQRKNDGVAPALAPFLHFCFLHMHGASGHMNFWGLSPPHLPVTTTCTFHTTTALVTHPAYTLRCTCLSRSFRRSSDSAWFERQRFPVYLRSLLTFSPGSCVLASSLLPSFFLFTARLLVLACCTSSLCALVA